MSDKIPLEIAKQMVEALESIGKVAFEVAQSDTGSKPAYIKAGWVIETCTKALALAPALLKHLEGMERAKEQLHNENIFFSKRYSVVSNAADLMREEIREYEKYFHEEAMEQVAHYDEVRKKQALEIPYCPNPPKAGE